VKIGAGMWRIVKEGTGVGVQQRLAQVILRRPESRASRKTGIHKQFMDSASAVVSKFGPVWAKQEAGDRPVGAWFLLCIWLVAPLMFAFVTILMW
jgi:hypothetical protein